MSHLIETMAYTGQTPWHNLGNQLPAKQPIDAWARAAGMDWSIHETPVRYMTSPSDNGSNRSSSVSDLYGEPMEFPDQKVLYRSDTKAPLSVVSSRYQVVQPKEVLEFYRDLTEVSGYELETAGVLKAGRKFWALARTGKSSALKGSDVVNGYLLLATSCDGTLATTATPTTVRVVCNNTLSIALSGASSAIRVPHSTSFNAQAVKKQLGIAVTQWDGFMYRMKTLPGRAGPSVQPRRPTSPGSGRCAGDHTSGGGVGGGSQDCSTVARERHTYRARLGTVGPCHGAQPLERGA